MFASMHVRPIKPTIEDNVIGDGPERRFLLWIVKLHLEDWLPPRLQMRTLPITQVDGSCQESGGRFQLSRITAPTPNLLSSQINKCVNSLGPSNSPGSSSPLARSAVNVNLM